MRRRSATGLADAENVPRRTRGSFVAGRDLRLQQRNIAGSKTRSRRDARPVGIRSVDRARTEKLRPVTPPITSLPHFRMPYYELVDQSMAGSPQGVTRGIMWQGASRSISPVIRTSTVFCGVIAGTA